VCNIDLSYPAVPSTCGHGDHVETYTPVQGPDRSVSFTHDHFSGYGWIAGTNPTLGDSHDVAGAKFFTFHLDRASLVTITVTPALEVDPLDAAFSLYVGTLPAGAHDDAAYDPLNPVDPITFLPVASPADAAPQRRWRYRPHDGFRDTRRYSTTGGLDADGNPVHPFVGQFDALGSFSIANADAIPGDPDSADGNWAKIFYILSVNDRPAGVAERLRAFPLAAGDYTLAVGGANCNDDTAACTGPHHEATISVSTRPLFRHPRGRDHRFDRDGR
jgi:hypothetical protein